MGLAARVAGVFERYALYRAETTRAWREGAGDDWQARLWRHLAKRLPPDPGRLVEAATARLREQGLVGVPGRVAVFSVGSLPPLHVDLLGALGAHRDVHLFVLAPGPDDGDHPLLTSMGALTRDFRRAVSAQPHQDRPAWVTPPEHTALGALQADLLRGRLPDEPRPFPPGDRSIQVHSCHGPLRQVQVLRDALLALFDEHPDLEPRDVVVMAPDVETFAPLVQAVFDDGVEWSRRDDHPGGLPRIPYRLADRGLRSDNPAADALSRALDLADGRLPASEVLDLLGVEAVRAHVGLDADGLSQARAWVASAGIRWGADAAHRAREGQPAVDDYTWRFGLDRLLLGQAVADTDLLLGVLPHGDLEGKDARDALGRFADFATGLAEAVAGLAAPRPVRAWSAALLALLDRLVGDGGHPARQVRAVLAAWARQASDAGFSGDLDLRAVRAFLAPRLASRDAGAGFLAGAVTVCQLVPMRSIPFRVVCLVGLDDEAFPRKGERLGFDAMVEDPRPGDRDARLDDRALFLEAILSARDHLVVTTTGRSVTDDRRLPPAIPVGELLDALDASFARASEHVTTEHPLQPYSPRSFAADAPFGVDRRLLAAAHAWRQGRRSPTPLPPFVRAPLSHPEPIVAVDLDRLVEFWQDPVKHLCRRRLGIWLPQAEDAVEDREPLDLAQLAKWKARDALLGWRLGGCSAAEARDRARRAGLLPPGSQGTLDLDALEDEVEAIVDEALALRGGGPRPPLDVVLDLDGVRLTGRLGEWFPGGRVTVQAGKVHARHRLAEWIRHLASSALDVSRPTVRVGEDGAWGLRPWVPEAAREQLGVLIRGFAQGQRVPLLFWPEAGEAWAEAAWSGESEEEARAAAVASWRQAHATWGEPGEYGRWLLGEACPYAADWDPGPIPVAPEHAPGRLAVAVWGPVFDVSWGEP